MGIQHERIIDTHHHLWRYDPGHYAWIDNSMDILKRDYLPPDLEVEMVKSTISATIAVQARQTLGETGWLLETADQYPFIRGVVGWFDLQSPDLKSQLERYSGDPRLVGVRHVIHDEPDDDFMLQPSFLTGIEMLQAYGLVYDLLLFPRHLERAIQLVSMFPEQRFVLDHMGKPMIRTGILQPWKRLIESLAGHPNVWCKVSGMVTEADRRGWRYEEFVPYLDTVLHAFGTERIMLGSDWPVCRLAGEYREVMEIPLRFFSNLNERAQIRIRWQNAVACYQLERTDDGKQKISVA